MPGISSERMHFYLGRYAGDARDELRAGVAGEHEDTTAVEFGLADLARMADANELADVKTLLLLPTLRKRPPSLFTPNAPDRPRRTTLFAGRRTDRPSPGQAVVSAATSIKWTRPIRPRPHCL
jgi:hypothetical protein